MWKIALAIAAASLVSDLQAQGDLNRVQWTLEVPQTGVAPGTEVIGKLDWKLFRRVE